MSSSVGDPSRKMPWYRKMMAKLDKEARAQLAARKALPESNVERRKKKQEDILAGK